MEDAEVVLRRAPLFEGLDEESARALRRQMPDVKLSRGEHLFLEGQDGDRNAHYRQHTAGNDYPQAGPGGELIPQPARPPRNPQALAPP